MSAKTGICLAIALFGFTLISPGPGVSLDRDLRVMQGQVTGVIAHGGGCRKSSPPGQCCHAGSEPYHCH